MTYYAKKMRAYSLFSLVCILLANLVFVFAFCVLFCGQDFSLSYYSWLKTVDVCLVVPITLLIGLNLYLINNIEKNSKQKKFLNVLFNVLEIILLCFVIINIISFYYGSVYVLFLVGLGIYLASQVVMMCSYFFVDNVDMAASVLLSTERLIQVYDGDISVSKKVGDVTLEDKQSKKTLLILLIFNIILNVIAMGLYFSIVDITLVGDVWYTLLALFLCIICFVNIACSVICIVFNKATIFRDLSIHILYTLIPVCNVLLLPVFFVVSYLSANAGLDFVGLMIVFVSTMVVNYCICKYIYELRHIYKKITHKDKDVI